MEKKAREELEDMLLRIERHFKAEMAARRAAEQALAEASASEGAAHKEVARYRQTAEDDTQVCVGGRQGGRGCASSRQAHGGGHTAV